jgi:hypothetical protein
MSDNKQLEVQSFIEFCRDFFSSQEFNDYAKREKKRKWVKGSKIEDFIFYLSHSKVVPSRGMHRKSLVRG